jgi:hypothetical protein
MLLYFMDFWSILRTVGTFYGHLVYFTAIWYNLWPWSIFSRFGMLYQEKSGNPAAKPGGQCYVISNFFLKIW